MYYFDSITLDFIKSFIFHGLENKIELEFLLIIMQNVGTKIRSDNPKVLKDIIDKILS